jgi:hypothetical protein
MNKRILSLILLTVASLFMAVPVSAEATPNALQARRIFDHAYGMFYGDEGSSFHYRISILGIYSEEGNGWYKGNMSKSVTRKSIIWDNGDIKYILKKGKDIVEIHDPKVNKKDKLLQKFKLYPEDFNYSIARQKNDLIITLKAKSNAKGSMKHIQIYLEPGSYKPKRLRIKVLFFWANIYFSDFKAGGIDDDIFTFPKEKYANYKLVDER